MDLAEGSRLGAGALDELADEELLTRFTSRREEAAFAALLRRHGPLVLSVCRRLLQDEHDAEDAFQAVFCVLARKGGAIRRRGALAAWLYAVAFRIARKARASRSRRPVLRSDLPEIPAAPESPEWLWREIRAVLDEEVNRLPDKYQRPFVLCYLEGKTNEQAAAELGCPLGTVLSRLARARDRLRGRLTRRGLALSTGMLAAALGQYAVAAVPGGLADTATQAALHYGAGQPVAAGVAALADGFLRAVTKIRLLITLGLASGLGVMVAVVLLLWFLQRGPGPGNAPAGVTVSPQTEQQKLEGSWRVISVHKAGQPQPDVNVQFGFADDRWTMSVAGVQLPPRPYALDPSQEPKAIDFSMAEGKVVLGIYRLDGNSLTLCVNQNSAGGKRPTAFRTQSEDAMVTLWVLEREPAGPDDGTAPGRAGR
jgi:RNA polymerase sigma factor (sigma-70 family)